MIVDTVFPQGFFKTARLVIATVQDRVIAAACSMGKFLVEDIRDHAFGFMIRITAGQDRKLCAVSQLAPEFFFKYMRVLADQGIGAF